MANDKYTIFGLNENATIEDVTERYNELKRKYTDELFQEGENGNNAAKRLTELENAYSDFLSEFNKKNNESFDIFFEVEEDIKNGRLQDAQTLLDGFDERNAKWHYLQSVIYYKKSWFNESKKQLEIACDMDSSNEKYKSDLKKLNDQLNNKTEFNNADEWNVSGNSQNNRTNPSGQPQQQMGGTGCFEACCQFIWCNTLLNCFCNGCR